uniref:Unannotated protein n=1 Tax=freshwater metagenome TaxID=449393 RepID=A0A6J5ZRD3_9ZZZZ
MQLGVEDLNAGREIDVAGGDLTGAGDDQRRLDLGGIGMHPADDALEVQDDVGDVFGHALDRRELVAHALDSHACHSGAGERAEQHASKRVAEGVAEATVERFDYERAVIVVAFVTCDSGDLKVEHVGDLVLWL